MGKTLKAFQIMVGGRIFDYRLGENLDLELIKTFFQKKYTVKKIWSGGRHVLGILEKDKKTLFLKLATSEGISEVTKNEYNWNEQFNKLIPRKQSDFWVPQNIECGIYNSKFFYLITDKFEGELLAKKPEKSEISNTFIKFIPSVIRLSELIQNLDINLSGKENTDHKERFFQKTKYWYKDIPKDVRYKYKIDQLLNIVENNVSILKKKPRHGDFTPWHLIKLPDNKLGLLDGEHARNNGVEYYDIGYFIQRVFSVLQNQDFAQTMLVLLIKAKYDITKLRVILAARGIGGFLDESLKSSPNYIFSNKFKDWVIKLNNNTI